MSNLIEVCGVTFKYNTDDFVEQAALKDISLSIEKGSFTVILGHNGSGKSTLAKLLNGLLKPDSGKVLVDGLNTAEEENTYAVRRRVGMVFQNPDNQIVCTIVEEDVAFGPENLGIEPAEIRRRVDGALSAVGMTEYKLAAPDKLSGGQKQRVALAGVLAMEPDCIVLDEPTAMLDPVGRREVMNAVVELNRKKGITIILITHFMEEARFADRVLVMNDGQLTADGTPQSIFEQTDVLKQAGLALPQTTSLLLQLRRQGIAVDTGVISPEDTALAIARAAFGRE